MVILKVCSKSHGEGLVEENVVCIKTRLSPRGKCKTIVLPITTAFPANAFGISVRTQLIGTSLSVLRSPTWLGLFLQWSLAVSTPRPLVRFTAAAAMPRANKKPQKNKQ